MFHAFAVFIPSGDDIDPGRVDAAVAEYVCKLCNVFLDPVKCAGKQVAKIVREYFFGGYVCPDAKPFHFPPDIGAAHRFAASCYEYCSRAYLLGFGIVKQFLLQIFHDKHRSCFALERNDGFAALYRFYRYVLQFAHTDPSSANRL